MRRIFLIGLIAAAVALPSAASARLISALGITLQSCNANVNGNVTNGINVVFYNAHQSPATEVDFLVRYHGRKYVLVDRGTFTVGAKINHNINNALVGVPWQGPDVKLCMAQRVILANGKVVQ
ncbi:MAG: hypothetical protein WAM84_12640 [Candidatus Cybelea sp.]